MKKMRSYTNIKMMAIALTAMLLGCQRTPVDNPTGTILLVDDAKIAQGQSKVNATGFDTDDQIAFYAVRLVGTQSNEIGGSTTYINHELYKKRAADGLFASWDGTTFRDRHFPADGSSIDIYGFYPYSATKPANYTSHTFTVLDKPASIADYNACDFMAAKTPSISPRIAPNKLTFNHLLSRMVVNLNLVNFPITSSIKKVQILRVNKTASINLRAYDATTGIAGRVNSSSNPTDITPFSVNASNGFTNTWVAIVPPQTLTSNKRVIEITLSDGKKDTKYFLTLTKSLTLVSGKEHTFNLSIDPGSTKDIAIEPSITAWSAIDVAGSTIKASDHKFVTKITNPNSIAIGNVTQVKVEVNNGTRTFTLPAVYVSGSPATVNWEFRGVGNRPIDYPFTIQSIEFLNGNTSLCKVNSSAGISIVKTDASETTAMGLNADLNAKTLTR